MKIELDFNLTRPAKKSGGDRYEHGVEKSPEHMVLYLPQFISRERELSHAKGMPFSTVKVTIEAE